MIDTQQYTENQAALLANVDLHEGATFDTVAIEAAESGVVRDRKTARNVLNQLIRKGVLAVETREEPGATWLTLRVEEPWFSHKHVQDEEEDLIGPIDPQPYVATHTEVAIVKEQRDPDGTEWTETIFPDGSRTLKRRRMVSGSWRTDYWGAESAGEPTKATSARLAREARVHGHFSHVPV